MCAHMPVFKHFCERVWPLKEMLQPMSFVSFIDHGSGPMGKQK